MISQVIQFKNLTDEQKGLLNVDLEPERMIYLIKDHSGNVKSMTTSVMTSIQKLQSV